MTQPLRAVVAEGSAKINVGWRVGERRADGYHDVTGLIQTISLVDRLEFTPSEDDDAPLVALEVPSNAELEAPTNLVVRAAEALADRARSHPVRVVLHKTIPLAAGLGGGSADAAATLVALNVLWGARLAPAALLRLAAEVGSDVPAILRGGLVAVGGRGEHTADAGSFTAGNLVIGVSEDGISAADAYTAFDRVGGGEPDGLAHNDLQRAAVELMPDLTGRLDAMAKACGTAFVSGSGPTVIGVARDLASAQRAREAVAPHFAQVLLATPSTWGVRLSPAT